jgi:hypothetical protein
MQKVIIGLIILLGLCSCKKPELNDSGRTVNDEFKSTHTTSDNLGLAIKITHEKSARHDSGEIKENPIEFSLELVNELDRSLEVMEAEGDKLQFYINETPRTLTPIKCAEPLFGLYEYICKYTYSYKSNNVIEESLHVRVTLTRSNGEVLSATVDLPSPIQLVEPHIPFNPVLPNGLAVLSWQSNAPIGLTFYGGVSECFWEEKAVTPGEQDTYIQLSADLFRPKDPCGEYTFFKTILRVYKDWSALEGSSFKKVNIHWVDSYHVVLLGNE